jgi:formamidopyrimidine-DNA glycosylase
VPELPEVETVVRGLRDDVIGRTITGAEVDWPPQIVGMPPEGFADRLRGQRIERLYRRGKYIVFELSDDVLIIHLRMTGRLYVAAPGEVGEADRWLRVMFPLDDGRELRFSNLRKLGRVYLVADVDEVLGGLGPEPLADDFTLDAFRERLARRSGVIKPLLLNQSFIAGVGNIYADEALWHARIAPTRRADTLDPAEVERLYDAVRLVLQEGIRHEGSSFSWYRKPDGSPGGYQRHFKAYGRTGEPCPRCGTPLTRITLGQRGTHFCPVCQQ